MLRREARAKILKALYGSEFSEVNPDPVDNLLADCDPGGQREFIEDIYRGTLDKKEKIDELISSFAVGWKVERLAFLDRNILRMAIYELLYYDDTPPEVVMNEAIELSKEYGTDNAPKFINGILDRVWKEEKGESEELKN
ncbi:transcription antitermination factor NusB [Candidatus Bipolaricaulota bacterium]|nr:transcription antitermination factor NusB [Candidatus Bipolaricaulota bacterium]